MEKSPGATALLDKYALLQKGMEKARRDTMRIKTEHANIEEARRRVLEARHKMQDQLTEATKAFAKDAVDNTDYSKIHLNLQRKVSDLEAKRNNLKSRWHESRIHASNNLFEFRAQAEEFRKQFRLRWNTLTELKHEDHRIQGNTEPSGESRRHDISFRSIQMPNELSFSDDSDDELSTAESAIGTVTMEEKPKWKGDKEMTETIERMNELEKSWELARVARNGAREAVEEARRKLYDRDEQRKKQRTQLERIRNNISEIQAQIHSLQNDTKELMQAGQRFAKDACRKKRGATQQTKEALKCQPSPTPITSKQQTIKNPYARPREFTDEKKVEIAPPADQINYTEQYPHRCGRVRVHRQFSTALQIGRSDPIASKGQVSDEFQVGLGYQHTTLEDDEDDDELNEILSFCPFSQS